jgi:uncharacterized membrane protein
MIGSKQLMPKRLRYPIFLLGLVVILGGSIETYAIHAGTPIIAAVVAVGFLLLFLSVAIR